MVDISATVVRLGGIAQKQQLVARGARDLDLTRAVRDGTVVRARQGWYTTVAESEPRVRAARVGGRLTGVSAIRDRGGWVLSEHPLHVSVPRNSGRLRSQWNRRRRLAAARGVRIHWDEPDVARRGTAWQVGLVDALVRVALDEDLETAVAAIDWAMHSGRLDEIDFERVLLRLPRNRRWIRDWVDARCESLPESLARTRLRLAGHEVAIQIPLGAQRIDVVIDGIVGLEIDGMQFHADTFEQDHRKSLDMTIAGLYAMAVSAKMVFHDWGHVLRAVEAALASHAFGNSGTEVPHEPRVPQPHGQHGPPTATS